MYICVCRAVTKNNIIKKFHEGYNTLNKIKKSTKLGSQCGVCEIECKKILLELKDTKKK
jgi:bacterioferritin-associated ferredoxin